MVDQIDLFSAAPEGLLHQPDLLTPTQELKLVEALSTLEFRPFEFHGFAGNRRVVSFGWRYAFDGSGLHRTEPIPDFLLPIREQAAAFGRVETQALQQVLLTEYAPGAAIGWHRDRSVFGDVVGVSLLSPARLRFRRKDGARWQRAELRLQPRSAYRLSGAARYDWEHSIPAVEALRYSITFRTLRRR